MEKRLKNLGENGQKQNSPGGTPKLPPPALDMESPAGLTATGTASAGRISKLFSRTLICLFPGKLSVRVVSLAKPWSRESP